jgi:hypothetical protein
VGLATSFITAQVAIDDQTAENGCILGVIPKHLCPVELATTVISHKAGGDPDLDGRAGAIRPEVASSLPWQYLPCEAGSLFLFNHWFPHYSEGNKSAATRRTAYFLYNAASEGDLHECYARLMCDTRARFAANAPAETVDPTQPDWMNNATLVAQFLGD